MKGRTVKIYLVDGIPSGIMTAEIMNWTGKLIVVPRSQLADLAQRDELKKTGVYILAGQNPEDPAQEMVYIGESDNIWSRLTQHNNDNSKDFWIKTIIIISKDENLTKAHGRYLESQLIQISSQAQRAKVSNATNPTITGLPEPDIADMEYFLTQIQMILPVLGFSFAIPLPKINAVQNSDSTDTISPVFYFNYAGTEAKAQEINGEFIVFKGSTARKKCVDSLRASYIQIRDKLSSEGRLVDSHNSDYWIFTQNVPFPSPSAAANIVGGASLNGRQLWRVESTGKTYSEWQDALIMKANKVKSSQNASDF